MNGTFEKSAILPGVVAAIAAFAGLVYLWREWAIVAVIVAALFLMGGFMPSRRGGPSVQMIYGGFVIGIVCAMGWLMLMWR